MYFTNEDYAIFTAENAVNKSREMSQKRRALQQKLLNLHNRIYPEVVKLRLSCHEREQNITSNIGPNEHGHINSWLIVRYGKTPDEIAGYKEIGFGFTKHACIQYGLFDGRKLEISLFLGRKGGWDREKIKDVIDKNRAAIESEIAKLKGYGMKWEITGCEPFEIDNNDPSDFCDWLIKHNAAGEESFLSYVYDINDERLSEENIADEVLSKITLLNGLYNAMVQRW